MYQRMQNLLQRRADWLMAGRGGELAQDYLFPVALYLDNAHLVMTDAAHLARFFDKLRLAHLARGLARVTVEVMAMDLPRNDRFRVWARYRELDAKGRLIEESAVVQYCRHSAAGIRFEMSEYNRCATGDLSQKNTRRMASGR